MLCRTVLELERAGDKRGKGEVELEDVVAVLADASMAVRLLVVCGSEALHSYFSVKRQLHASCLPSTCEMTEIEVPIRNCI